MATVERSRCYARLTGYGELVYTEKSGCLDARTFVADQANRARNISSDL